MNIATDMQLGVIPALASVGLVVMAFGFWLVFRAKNRPRQRAFFIEFFYWLTNPLVELLVKFGVTANAVTATSLVFSIGAGFALAYGLFFTTLFILMVGSSCDVLDGQVARRSGLSSRSGAFLDSFIDRLSEGALLTGAAWFGHGGWLTLVAFLTMVSGFSISYARARGEALGVDSKVGLMQRPARMVYLLFLFFGAAMGAMSGWTVATAQHVLTGGLLVLALLSAYTVVQRVSHIMAQLKQSEREAPLVGTPENSAV